MTISTTSDNEVDYKVLESGEPYGGRSINTFIYDTLCSRNRPLKYHHEEILYDSKGLLRHLKEIYTTSGTEWPQVVELCGSEHEITEFAFVFPSSVLREINHHLEEICAKPFVCSQRRSFASVSSSALDSKKRA